MIALTIVIPVYNEEKTLPSLYERLLNLLPAVKLQLENSENSGSGVEILFVNDGSRDDTESILQSIVQSRSDFRYISFSRNFGHQAAVLAGLRFARGEWIPVMDADLQDPPELIMDMLKSAREGFDVVYAVRRTRETTWYKNFSYKLYYILNSLISDQPVHKDSGDFSLVSRRVVDIINKMPEKEIYIRGLRAWVGFRQTSLPYDRKDREHGESKYSFKSLVKLAFRGILSTSTKPLLLSGCLTIVSILLVLGIILYVLIPKLFLVSSIPKGWASVMITMCLLSGFQLLSLWMLSLYVAKVYREVLGRPTFIVEKDSLTCREYSDVGKFSDGASAKRSPSDSDSSESGELKTKNDLHDRNDGITKN